MASIRLLVLLLVCPLVAACGETPTSPSHYAPYSQTDIVVGTGAEATATSMVSVRYTLWLYDTSTPGNRGLQLETNVGGDPLAFRLGQGAVIAGWNQGVPGMRVGGRRQLIVPPSLAYGDSRAGAVPPNATLIFEIELLEVSS